MLKVLGSPIKEPLNIEVYSLSWGIFDLEGEETDTCKFLKEMRKKERQRETNFHQIPQEDKHHLICQSMLMQ